VSVSVSHTKKSAGYVCNALLGKLNQGEIMNATEQAAVGVNEHEEKRKRIENRMAQIRIMLNHLEGWGDTAFAIKLCSDFDSGDGSDMDVPPAFLITQLNEELETLKSLI
jgi:hypothetical protein